MLFVTSAVENVRRSHPRHFRQAPLQRGLLARRLTLQGRRADAQPTFVAFTPWTSLEGYVGLSAIWDLDLVANVSPVQYGIRLLRAEGSRLLELEEVQEVVGDFDEAALCWTWAHEDPRVDGSSNG